MNYQITDKSVYQTTIWTIESEEDTYHVTCQENDFHDSWRITSDMLGEIGNNTELGFELIRMCEFDEQYDF